MKKNVKGAAAHQAFQSIKNMMYLKELSPGQKLIYSDLAKKLKMSITPISHALHRLEHLNLVQYQTNKGYIVGEVNEKEIKELYAARESLEKHLIPIIIKKLNKKKLSEIRKSFKKYHQENDRRLLLLIDAQFHLTIYKIADNDVIYGFLDSIFERICLKYRPEYLLYDRKADGIKEHRNILKALEMGDGKAAMAVIAAHNKNSMNAMVNSLSRSPNLDVELGFFTGTST